MLPSKFHKCNQFMSSTVKMMSSMNMNHGKVKHLKMGDPQPPLKKEILRLYSMRFCPYAQRVHLVLDSKKIPYDVVFANLHEKPEWLYSKSDRGKVPAIEFANGKVLSESLIISDFLEELYPNPALYPKDPIAKETMRVNWILTTVLTRKQAYKQFVNQDEIKSKDDSKTKIPPTPSTSLYKDVLARTIELNWLGIVVKVTESALSKQRDAEDRLFVERFTTITRAFFKIFFHNELTDEIFEKTLKTLDVFEKELTKRNSLFFGGTKPGMLDLMIWPWMERFPLIAKVGGETFKLPVDRLPKIVSWEKAMIDDEGVKGSYINSELHLKYLLSWKSQNPQYDFDNSKL